MFVPEGVRKIIKSIKKGCSKCKIINKKTVELRMSTHPEARTLLAPPFYSIMINVAYGFPGRPYKRARAPKVSIKFYALVIVCIMSGATSIWMMEGLETQDVIQALERHTTRHGVPADIHVDNGSQLKALKHGKFTVLDVSTNLHHNQGMKIHVLNAKAHQERERLVLLGNHWKRSESALQILGRDFNGRQFCQKFPPQLMNYP